MQLGVTAKKIAPLSERGFGDVTHVFPAILKERVIVFSVGKRCVVGVQYFV